MSDHPQNPTLLIGLGAFGRAVLELATPPTRAALATNGIAGGPADAETGRAGGVRNLETIHVGADAYEDDAAETGTRILLEASARCRRLLDLAHYLETTRPTDSRGPRVDVFIIADLSDVWAAVLVPVLTETLAAGLRAEFRPILRAGDGALAVCPLIAVPSSAAPDRVSASLEALARASAHEDLSRRPLARIYVVEDQSGKYLLSSEELRRSFAAFLHLLLFSRLRDEQGRALVERTAEQRGGPFATFACATLEVDMVALHRLCAVKLARELLEQFRLGGDPVLAEIAGEAHPLVPDPLQLEEELWKEGTTGTLEDHLEPPEIPVAQVGEEDSPEDIVEHKFGVLWLARAERALEQFRDDVERFKMDRLAHEIERNGTVLVERVEEELLQRVRSTVASGPRGHARALEFVRWAATRAEGERDRSGRRIESPDLPDFPPPPLERCVAAIKEAVFARPRRRPFRMQLFGTLLSVVGTILMAGAFDMGSRFLGWDSLVGWVTWTLAALFVGSTVYYALWAHTKRHHNWVTEARDWLDQSLKKYLHRDIVEYFRRRLHYTRTLWVHRIYRRVADRLRALIAQLEGTRAALAEADRRLAVDERDLAEELNVAASGGGILFRGLIQPEMVDACYLAERPPTCGALAEQLLAETMSESETMLEAPYADPGRALAFCLQHLEHLAERSPFGPDETPLSGPVIVGVRDFLRQLALKLSTPLEMVEAFAQSTGSTGRRFAVVPPAARAMVEQMLAEENLGGWTVHARSDDPCRIHLVLEQGELVPDALALFRGGRLPEAAP